MLPKDPVMLLSYMNMKLRDNYSSLDALCDDLEINKEELAEIIGKLEGIGYKYDSGKNMGKYYYAFRYLPVMNASGESYQYRVVEHEDSVGEYVKIYYPASDSSDTVPADNTAMQDSTDDFSFVLHEGEQDPIFVPGQIQLLPVAGKAVVPGVQHDTPMLQHGSRTGKIVGSAKQSLHLCHKDIRIEGLGNKIIRAHVHGHDDIHII